MPPAAIRRILVHFGKALPGSVEPAADESEPELEPRGKENIEALLILERLEKFCAAIVEEGYSFVDDLLEADDEELAQLTKDLQMKKPEARRFLKAVASKKSAAEGTCEAAGAAALLPVQSEHADDIALSCSICFEPYGNHTMPRILAGCGHTFCGGCLDKMLRQLPARGGEKKLCCPTCRTECVVPRGQAAELPVNFAIMGLHG